jgi:DNA-binding NarL/FixJ family response regulator
LRNGATRCDLILYREERMLNIAEQAISVWLVEDSRSFSRSAAAAINESDGLRCPRVFRCCEDALAALAQTPPPDVVLMDIGLPGMSGIEGIRHFRQRAPGTEVVVLTVFEDEGKLFAAICAGASGYLLKSADLDEIAAAIRLAKSGGSPMNPRIARRVLSFFTQARPAGENYGLTEREKEILHLLVDGLIKKEIAGRLSVSFHTVDMHVRHIYEKLHVNTRTGAVAKAMRERL